MSNHRRSQLLTKCFVASLALSLPFFGCSRKIQVSVTNSSGQPLEKVNIVAQGQEFSLGTIAPGGTRSTQFEPRQDSAITLNFVPPAPHEAVSQQLLYFEAGYRGSVDASVEQNFEVNAIDGLKIAF